MKKIISIILAGILAVSMTACGGEPADDQPQPSDTSSQSPQVDSATTSKSNEETEISAPIIYTGSGDDIIEIQPPEGVYVFHIVGNDDARHFSVTAYDSNYEYLKLLVNTSNPYNGVVVDYTLTTSLLEISASGPWAVELISRDNMETITSNETLTGSGDMLFWVDSNEKTAIITGNDESRYFGVHAYGKSEIDTLVNTTKPYNGKVMLKNDPYLISITAEGDWSFSLGSDRDHNIVRSTTRATNILEKNFGISTSDLVQIIRAAYENFPEEETAVNITENEDGSKTTQHVYMIDDCISVQGFESESGLLTGVMLLTTMSKVSSLEIKKDLNLLLATLVAIFEPDNEMLKQVDADLAIGAGDFKEDTLNLSTGSISEFLYVVNSDTVTLFINPKK